MGSFLGTMISSIITLSSPRSTLAPKRYDQEAKPNHPRLASIQPSVLATRNPYNPLHTDKNSNCNDTGYEWPNEQTSIRKNTLDGRRDTLLIPNHTLVLVLVLSRCVMVLPDVVAINLYLCISELAP